MAVTVPNALPRTSSRKAIHGMNSGETFAKRVSRDALIESL